VDFLRAQAKSAAGADSNNPIERVAACAVAAAAETFANQIERGNDLTLRRLASLDVGGLDLAKQVLLALHDLDLGALAHKVGVTGEGFTTEAATAMCETFITDDDARFDMVYNYERRSDSVDVEACRQFAALGAKVRAALSATTIKAATPRVLQSADEAQRVAACAVPQAEPLCNWERETRAVLVRALHLDPDDARSNVALAAELAVKYQEASEALFDMKKGSGR